jgi:hypothetical protein
MVRSTWPRVGNGRRIRLWSSPGRPWASARVASARIRRRGLATARCPAEAGHLSEMLLRPVRRRPAPARRPRPAGEERGRASVRERAQPREPRGARGRARGPLGEAAAALPIVERRPGTRGTRHKALQAFHEFAAGIRGAGGALAERLRGFGRPTANAHRGHSGERRCLLRFAGSP